MKKYILLIFITSISFALCAQTNPAEQLAQHIANKMKDSLNLTAQQRNNIYQLNMTLHNQKTLVRQQFAGHDSLRVFLQQVENTRDSLYRTILNVHKYQLYLQKKRNLVSSN